jgi:hypothetical protein
MSVRKTGSGYSVVHCHGKSKGKVIARFDTKREAMAMHKAIQANKRKR